MDVYFFRKSHLQKLPTYNAIPIVTYSYERQIVISAGIDRGTIFDRDRGRGEARLNLAEAEANRGMAVLTEAEARGRGV
jgi:hypothetical protein